VGLRRENTGLISSRG